MLLPLSPLLIGILLHAGDSTGRVYNGRQRQLTVAIPRYAVTITVDGVLDEPVWGEAALLTGFSSYSPVDGKPAEDSTEVLVWYSATAIYFGIRAFEAHGSVHATLADRDHIDGDDFVQILLDPFDDHRRAYVFAVNPLGVQADGMRSEGSFGPIVLNQSFGANPGVNIDLSADFLYQSKGHVTSAGYEVEVRIPFKSLRYQPRGHEWGIQIIRQVQHSGYQQTWTPAMRGSASFLAQSGALVGLSDLRRGLVLELNPEAATVITGDSAVGGGWRYRGEPQLGGNVRWGVLPNVTLNGTVRPDFSQIEADATQIAGDIRFALFYPEKRPFFVDGIEQFETPSRLVYTRTIVQPDAAAKVTGKVGSVDIAYLSAIDSRTVSFTGADHPVFNILRLRRDVGPQSTVGVTYTDRIDGRLFNRVAAADARIVFAKLYYAELQAGASVTRDASGRTTPGAPLWEAVLDGTGRSFGFHYAITGVHPDFVAAAGFVPRTDYVRPSINNRVTVFGPAGSLLESWVMRLGIDGTWLYHDLFAARPVLEQTDQFNHTFTLRGGWSIGLTPVYGTFAFDPGRYNRYAIERRGAVVDTIPFAVSRRTHALYVRGRVQTPQYPRFSALLTAQVGRDVDFFETAPVHRVDVTGIVDVRPTPRLRVSASYARSEFRRWRDRTALSSTAIPRLKTEYQLSRAVFFRFVGQYDASWRDALRDPRTGFPLLIRGGGVYAPAAVAASNDFRMDWLFAYQPDPGTVFFAGYGSSFSETDPLAFRDLRRARDGFFVKLSYLFRL
jgi:hypothetical protein